MLNPMQLKDVHKKVAENVSLKFRDILLRGALFCKVTRLLDASRYLLLVKIRFSFLNRELKYVEIQ